MPAKSETPEMPAKDDTPEKPPGGDGHMTSADPKTGKFEPIPDMPACATGAVVRGNPRSGPSWVYLKLESGCQVPWHWHTPNEELVVISGQGTLEMKDGTSIPIAPGVFTAMPSHHVHRANCSRACLFFSMSSDAYDIHYVDANGEEIKLEEAVKAGAPPSKPKIQKKPIPKKK
jgi:quercetin dioxygenase-like cupin family protein